MPNVNASPDCPPYDYIVCTTKNYPDVSPTCLDVISPAVTVGHTTIILIQNGLNIQNPIVAAFPENVVLSGVSFCGSHQLSPGDILHEDNDSVSIGPFENQPLMASNSTLCVAKAKEFVDIYGAGGKSYPEVSFFFIYFTITFF